jgi:hypothetical protein
VTDITAEGFLAAYTGIYKFSTAAPVGAVRSYAMPAFPGHLSMKNILGAIRKFQGGHHAS